MLRIFDGQFAFSKLRSEVRIADKVSDVQHGPLFIKPLVLSFPPFYLYDGTVAQLVRALL